VLSSSRQSLRVGSCFSSSEMCNLALLFCAFAFSVAAGSSGALSEADSERSRGSSACSLSLAKLVAGSLNKAS
jgi:hypothetical protein